VLPGQKCLLMTCLLVGLNADPAQGDGGAVRLSQRAGRYQITVFTSPVPLRVGLVDVSVLVQDAVTGKPLADLPIQVELRSLDHPGLELRQAATMEAATNKLFHAALFELPAPGRWHVAVTLSGLQESPRIGFEVQVGSALPARTALSFWLAWPAAAILLFAMHQVLARRSAVSRRGGPSEPAASARAEANPG
jgi:hypothetical protein